MCLKEVCPLLSWLQQVNYVYLYSINCTIYTTILLSFDSIFNCDMFRPLRLFMFRQFILKIRNNIQIVQV
jgi:hypothetical protein